MTEALTVMFCTGIVVGIFIGGLAIFVYMAWDQRRKSVPDAE